MADWALRPKGGSEEFGAVWLESWMTLFWKSRCWAERLCLASRSVFLSSIGEAAGHDRHSGQ